MRLALAGLLLVALASPAAAQVDASPSPVPSPPPARVEVETGERERNPSLEMMLFDRFVVKPAQEKAEERLRKVLAVVYRTVRTFDLADSGRLDAFWWAMMAVGNSLMVFLISSGGGLSMLRQQGWEELKEMGPRITVTGLLLNSSLVIWKTGVDASNRIALAILSMGPDRLEASVERAVSQSWVWKHIYVGNSDAEAFDIGFKACSSRCTIAVSPAIEGGGSDEGAGSAVVSRERSNCSKRSIAASEGESRRSSAPRSY